jgi:hypothetical protein
MSKLRKLHRRRSAHLAKDPPILIVRPHKAEGDTCEATSQFCAKAFKRNIADYLCLASATPDVARNKAITAFLRDPLHARKTHIFFLDDDSTPYNDFVLERLLQLNKPVIAGVTPIVRKRDAIDFAKLQAGIVRNEQLFLDCMWSAIIKEGAGMDNIGIDELPSKPFIAHRTGGTCLLIRRQVLEKLKPPYQMFEFGPEHINVTRSEDIYFSDQIREAGYDIWIDPESVCHHFHRWDLLDVFSIAMQAKQMGMRGQR